MVKVLYGNEPYVIMKRKSKIIDALQNKQMNLQKYEGKFDMDVYNSCLEYPFLEDKRVVLLEVETIKDLDTPLFLEYIEKPVASTDLLIICKSVDRKLKIYKKLSSLEIIVPCDKLDNETLKKAIQCEIVKKGGQIQEIALAELIKRLNYENEPSVNMLSIVGYIENMLAVDKGITLEMVQKYVPKYEEANVFGLSKLLLAESSAELLREIEMVDPDESIKTLSLLLRDFRIAYKLKFFDKKEVSDKSAFTSFSKCSTDTIVECMQTITDTIGDVKAGRTTNQQALKLACIKLFNLIKERAHLA